MHALIQERLQFVYRIDPPLAVDDYLVARSAAKKVDNWAEALLDRDEQLLVRATDESLEMALVFDDSILDALRNWAPDSRVRPQCTQELSLFCLAAEGVSHLLYAAWSACQRRSVRHVELELQADVDKYVVLAIEDGLGRHRSPSWIGALFESFALHPGLNATERTRYADANQLARRYCRYLQSEFVETNRPEALFAELRSFYRAGAEKLGRAAAA